MGFGFYNKKTNRVPDSEIIYSLGLSTKAFTATAVNLLAQQGHITLVSKGQSRVIYLRSIHPMPLTSARMPPLLDVLAQSTGLAPLIHAVLGKDDTVLTRLENAVHACSNISCVAPLR